MILDLAESAEEDAVRAIEDGVTLSLVASLATRNAWDASRRRHHAWGSRDKRGHADGTLRALEVCRGLTLVCVRCGALVHWMAARRCARKANRGAFAPGDGCSGRGCSGNHRPKQHASGQLAMAAALERPALASGARYLIAWPQDRWARKLHVQPRTHATLAANNARLRLVRIHAPRVVAANE